MSGAETGIAVGLTVDVISIIESTKKLCDAAKDAEGQLEAFRQVAGRLPLVIETLRSATERMQWLDETAQEALEEFLKSLKMKAEKLEKIFRIVIRQDDDQWYNRYKKAVESVNNEEKVERLMEGILKDIQVLLCERLMGTATEAQVKEIEQGIKEMNEVPFSLPDKARPVQMPPLPNREDIDATWNYLRAGIELILRSPDNPGHNPTTHIGLYTAVHNYCMSQKAVSGDAHRGAHLLGEELYQRLARYLTSYLEDLVRSRYDTGETLLAFYIREWNRYRAGARVMNHQFRYLNRHWIKPQLSEGKKNVFDVYTLHLIQWREVAFAKLYENVMETVLKMIKRQRNGETIEHGLIKSIVDSFVAIGLNEADPPKRTLSIYRHYFGNPFLDDTKTFYQNESKQFLADNGVVEYIRKVETWLDMEEERINLYLAPNIAEPLRVICNTALILDHETLLRGGFQILLDNDQVDELARMYNLLSRISGGLDFLPSKFRKGFGQSGFDISSSSSGSNHFSIPIATTNDLGNQDLDVRRFSEQAARLDITRAAPTHDVPTSNKDSGYSSLEGNLPAEATVAFSISSGPNFFEDSELLDEDDSSDIQSLLSVPDDIQSQASTHRTHQEIVASEQLGEVLARHEVGIYGEKAAVQLLRGRWDRIRVSQQIIHIKHQDIAEEPESKIPDIPPVLTPSFTYVLYLHKMQLHFDIKRSLLSADNSSSLSLSSLNALFSSDSSCDNSALNTPPLMQETFYNPINTGTMLFHPSSYAPVYEYFNNSDRDFSVPFYQTISPCACAYGYTRSQAMDGYGTLSLSNGPISLEFVSYYGLPSPPIDLQIQLSWSMAQEFAGYATPLQTYVVPSQTFVDSFEGHSLVGLSNALHTKEEYGSSFSESYTDFSYD